MSDESFREIRQLFSGLDTYIETFRNEMQDKDEDELIQLSEDKFRMFISVLNTIHLFSRPFFHQSDPLSLPDPDKSSRSEMLMGTIDADFLSMLIALEGMNIIVIYIHLYNFLNRFQNSALELMGTATKLFENPNDGQLSDLQNIIDNNQAILDILEGIHTLPATGVDSYQDLIDKIGLAESLNLSGHLEKYQDLSRSPIGKLLIRNAGSTKQFFSTVNWRPEGMNRGSNGFKLLDLAMSNFVQYAFGLTREVDEKRQECIINTIESPNVSLLLGNSLVSEYNEFNELSSLFEQLKTTPELNEKAQQDAGNYKTEMGNYMKMSKSSELSDKINVLKNPSSKFFDAYNQLAERSGVNGIWVQNLKRFVRIAK